MDPGPSPRAPMILALLLAALAMAAPPALAHTGHGDEVAQLETRDGEPALLGRLEGLSAPGDLAAALHVEGPLAADGRFEPGEYRSPALPAPGLAAAFRSNATHLAVAMEYGGTGWFLVGVDQSTASRALVMMVENIVARHAAVGGHFGDDGNLTWCSGQMGVMYIDPDAPVSAGHGDLSHPEDLDVQVSYDRASGSGPGDACARRDGVVVNATQDLARGVSRVEAAFPHTFTGLAPGEVRHVLLAFEPERRFLTPKITLEATRGDVNVLLLRAGDEPAQVGALLRGAPAGGDGAVLAAVPLGVLGVAWGAGLVARRGGGGPVRRT